jgi:hypothetical protein
VVLIYPNPARNYIEIRGSIGACSNEASLIASEFASEFIQIFDMLGVIQFTTSLRATPQRGEFKNDVSHLSPGLYFIKIENRVEKFVKRLKFSDILHLPDVGYLLTSSEQVNNFC